MKTNALLNSEWKQNECTVSGQVEIVGEDERQNIREDRATSAKISGRGPPVALTAIALLRPAYSQLHVFQQPGKMV